MVADTDAPPAKTKKGMKGYPKGIIDHKKSGKLQVRLSYQDENRKTVQRPIPNSLFGTMPEAVVAQAAAQQLLDPYVAFCSTPGHKPLVRVQSLKKTMLVRKTDRPVLL